MDDYEDDDYYDEDGWFYVEDTLLLADSLAEGAIGSPPPTFVADEEAEDDWDRFDYYNDLEYDSDGYDDANFHASQSLKGATPGQKRKRRGQNTPSRSRKKQKLERRLEPDSENIPSLKPVVWRSQADRELEVKQFDDRQEAFALLSDWRERLQKTPQENNALQSNKSKSHVVTSDEPLPSPAAEDDPTGEEIDVDPKVLMTILQSRLGEAGGPLSDMDPSKLLEYAMRMMNENESSDDIAGQLADDMMEQVDEDDEDPSAELTTWLAQQCGEQAVDSVLGAQNDVGDDASPSQQTTTKAESSKSPSFVRTSGTKVLKSDQIFPENQEPSASLSRKRKADENEDEPEGSTNAPKAKRPAKAYDTPTAASRARLASTSSSTRSTRPSRSKRS